MNDNKIPFMPVTGYLTSNWDSHDDRPPAVILNPDASPTDVLAWCWTEMVSMQAAATVLVAADGEISKYMFDVLMAHRLGPVTDVLEHIIDLHCIEVNLRAKVQEKNSQNGGAS